MKKRFAPAKGSLFLIELILSILILSLSAAICLPVFASAWENRKKAREWKQIQEIVTNASELLEASDGRAETYLENLPFGVIDKENVLYYYDAMWMPADSADAVYTCSLTPSLTDTKKALHIQVFSSGSTNDLLYEIEVSYPVFSIS